MPSFSYDVIIPAYNAEAYIVDSILSALNQTVAPEKIIVVDDGSVDKTFEVVSKLNINKLIYIKKDNGGPNSARNIGLKAARADYVAFLDADDVWIPNKIEIQSSLFSNSNYENIGIVYCEYELIDNLGDPLDLPLVPLNNKIIGNCFRELLKCNLILSSASGVLIRRVCFENVGVFDEDLRAAEDWDMWLRIAKDYAVDCPKYGPLVKIRFHSSNAQKNSELMFANQMLFYSKWISLLSQELRLPPVKWANHSAHAMYRDSKLFKQSFLPNISTVNKIILFRYTFGSAKLHMVLIHIYVEIRLALTIGKTLCTHLVSMLRKSIKILLL